MKLEQRRNNPIGKVEHLLCNLHTSVGKTVRVIKRVSGTVELATWGIVSIDMTKNRIILVCSIYRGQMVWDEWSRVVPICHPWTPGVEPARFKCRAEVDHIHAVSNSCACLLCSRWNWIESEERSTVEKHRSSFNCASKVYSPDCNRLL